MKPGIFVLVLSLVVLAACGGGGEPPPIDPAGGPSQDNPPDPSAAAGESATARAIEQLSAAYEELAGRLQENSGEAIDWAQDDIENLGDWEYRIEFFDEMTPEAMESELNMLGEERWEAYWVEPVGGGVRIYLKRPAVSFISRVPLGTLLRMLGGAGQ